MMHLAVLSKREVLHNLKNHTFCRLRRSRIHGIGVFAIVDIPKGKDPFPCKTKDEFLGFDDSELKGLHPNVRKMIYEFQSRQDGKIWVPDFGLNGMNISYFLNCSKRPNLKAVKGGEKFVTIRKIKAGEELTSDYAEYDEMSRGGVKGRGRGR